ncbi:MAG TPA: sigma-70 family RNA polymerase sigma factor [Polyangiaceae bacterium]|nr:sigma-70 family RNA polymerase sigma factor [Polyangiaceae bacterium]
MSADATFEAERGHLRRVAYRMLGSVSDAEDVVQEAYLRWRAVDAETIVEPRAFLTRVTTRLCLDQLKSARVRRESYVGTWLPEPVAGGVSGGVEGREDVSMALLMTLERLSPLERAAFLLHDVFDVDYAELSETLARSEAACRQLVARAREHVQAHEPRFHATPDATRRVVTAFQNAMRSGDTQALGALLAEDAVLYADGGGKRIAARYPVEGRDKIVKLMHGIVTKYGWPGGARFEPVELNGEPGWLVHEPDGLESISLAIDGERIAALYMVRNPDKLRHLEAPRQTEQA